MRTAMLKEIEAKGRSGRLALRVVRDMVPAGQLLDVASAVRNARIGPISDTERSLLAMHGLYAGTTLTLAGEQIAMLKACA